MPKSPLDVPCIYSITNLFNGKRYIGSSISFKSRKAHHLSYLRRNVHSNSHLQRAWNKYGEESFVFGIISIVENPDLLIDSENSWLAGYSPEYNSALFADAPGRGLIQSKETRRKRSETLKGRKLSPETIKKISAAASKRIGPLSPNFGRKFTPEHRAKISLNRRNASPEVGRKISASLKGKPTWNKGRKTGKPAWNRGVPATESQKQKQRLAMTGRKASESAKLKMSASHIAFHKRQNTEEKPLIRYPDTP